ncbi:MULTISPECIES: cysteine--1-D-myo-inosityl 2-amino-2-deoxy-alpha-D-glucopyranoside ligase [unclassified Rothia (in: high G+C Gram-positive bacteria)]|uniref:cysteine--1-D-myo-inosityl 2-amino-2-deoxy-alpha-D-glucopyranoside ligase n=1 Tax=unclassified Rothia (in: high G+C Gram-positive bacteria) TaxID=2689056 RepID=UPI001959A663|nr:MULTISPECIES: cysteine--1-D-myo-inosityl 2-amino-2-deoxy-alpha-D-glucopyranoside ligase [unclassified Rothia (in: high G+C Gram-positive bacteria)]MBM7050566.1 cysteine--1-D-myo-inosityl 2-amino-2-deoxy-alpha-D-glucopyranoside ligase [Rothia sp. ZJ1223]QRZ60758.1 cysteine--1-D-myo-inosityl 2-amino-2-deoxy-alpha-D-glucopyranoside ligase [Rothia sp. ZJ932]
MKSWQSPSVPVLPGTAPWPSIFDTTQQAVVQLPKEDAASLYVCGITPYDATHMGHASTYVAFDLLNRAWRDAGASVAYVQNVTDVDDPLLERATATGVDWRDLAQEQTELFHTDMVALNVLAPDHYVGAVESIEWIVPVVERWVEQGIAYRVPGFTDEHGLVHPDGDVYFDNAAAERATADFEDAWSLGDVSGMSREEMMPIFAERGGDPQRAGKRDALDPLLWRVAREGEPSWDGGALGAGRPGWHIECTMISQKFLPAPFTVQGGGSDLIFPHHEMGAGHAYAVDRKPMARHFAHTGMVGLEGEKMSKSLGNLVLVSKLRAAGVNPGAIRLAIMSNHYRSDWFWTDDVLTRAQERFELFTTASQLTGDDSAAHEALASVREYLADDLNAPAALDVLEAWARNAVAKEGIGGGALLRDILDARLGVKL